MINDVIYYKGIIIWVVRFHLHFVVMVLRNYDALNCLCRHMIKKKSKESFIAFKEAVKFKCFLSLSLSRSFLYANTHASSDTSLFIALIQSLDFGTFCLT